METNISKLPMQYSDDLYFIESIRNLKKEILGNYSFPNPQILPEIFVLSDLEWQIIKSLEIFEFEQYISEIINLKNHEKVIYRISLIPDTIKRNSFRIKLAEYYDANGDSKRAEIVYSMESRDLLKADLSDQAVGGWVENSNLIYQLVCSMKTNNYAIPNKLLGRMKLFNDLEQARFGNNLYTLKHVDDEVIRRNLKERPEDKYTELLGQATINKVSSIRSLKRFIPQEFPQFTTTTYLWSRKGSLLKRITIKNSNTFIERIDAINILELSLQKAIQIIVNSLQITSSKVKQDLLLRLESKEQLFKNKLVSDLTFPLIVCSLIEVNDESLSNTRIKNILNLLRENYYLQGNSIYLYTAKPKVSPRFLYLLQLLFLANLSNGRDCLIDINLEIKDVISSLFYFVTQNELMNQYSLLNLIIPSFLNKTEDISKNLSTKYF